MCEEEKQSSSSVLNICQASHFQLGKIIGLPFCRRGDWLYSVFLFGFVCRVWRMSIDFFFKVKLDFSCSVHWKLFSIQGTIWATFSVYLFFFPFKRTTCYFSAFLKIIHSHGVNYRVHFSFCTVLETVGWKWKRSDTPWTLIPFSWEPLRCWDSDC